MVPKVPTPHLATKKHPPAAARAFDLLEVKALVERAVKEYLGKTEDGALASFKDWNKAKKNSQGGRPYME